MRERDVTARVNYYICAGSEHLFGLLLKCNKNYIILKKMPSAAQWNILHHPSTCGTKITAIQNFGHLCLGALEHNYLESKYVTTVYDKRDDFNFKIVKYPFMDSNIPTKSAYGVYSSQLVRIGRICERYETFVERHRMITSRLIHQGFHYTKLCDSFKKFSRGHKSIFDTYGVSVK